eukprot:s1_g616.t1
MGRLVAKQLGAEGARLALTARRSDKLSELSREIDAAGGEACFFAADATQEDEAADVVEKTLEKFGVIDTLFLNAGGAPALDMRHMSAGDVEAYMRSNYDVVVNYLFPTLEHMKQQKSGCVVHTNSLAGLIGVPLQGPYCAGKGAAKLLLDTCRVEFAEFGIKFITIYPGFVATEATANDGMPAPQEISEEAGAAHIIKAMKKGKPEYFFPWRMAKLAQFGRLLPASMVDRLLKDDVPAYSEAG